MSYIVQIDDETRPANAQEIAIIEAQRQEAAAQIAALEVIAAAKASARAKLTALGLTDEEITAFLGA